MSEWTHVSGIIRYGHVPLGVTHEQAYRFLKSYASIGPSATGSEGSAAVEVHEYKMYDYPADNKAIYATIKGDLRDRVIDETLPEVIDWIEYMRDISQLKSKSLFVTSLIVQIEQGDGDTVVLTNRKSDEPLRDDIYLLRIPGDGFAV